MGRTIRTTATSNTIPSEISGSWPTVQRMQAALVACAVVLAFSPVLRDLLRHFAGSPWTLYSVGFLPLLWACARRDPPVGRSHWDGYLWLLVGVALELLAVAGGAIRIGRLGLPFGAIGLLRILGRGSLPTLILSLWLIPIPNSITELLSPSLEGAQLAISSFVLRSLGFDVMTRGATLVLGNRSWALLPAHGGLPLVALLSGLGWYTALRTGSDLLGAARRMLLWAALGIPLQGLALLFAALVAVLISVDAARIGLDFGLPVLVFGVALWCVDGGPRRESPR